jgi:hypothetical protein
MHDGAGSQRKHHGAALMMCKARDKSAATLELATTTGTDRLFPMAHPSGRTDLGTEQHDIVITVSDLNDRYPHDDPDVIAVSKNKEVARVIALVPVADLARKTVPLLDAGQFRRSDRGDADADRGAVPNGTARPSLGSRDLAAMMMFDLDRETM